MIRRVLWTVVLALCLDLLSGAHPASAQYMFLDFDGDGIYTGNDIYPQVPYQDSLRVDLYVVTNQNSDGSPAGCSPDGSPLDINSYTVSLYALDAAASFTNVTNHMPGMYQQIPLVQYPYALTVGYGGSQTFPPGKYRLMSLTARFGPGCPALTIAPSTCYTPAGGETSFGTSTCPGTRGDYVLRLAEDWGDALGSIGCTDLPGRWPSMSCPGEVHGMEGEPLSITATLTDPDCEIFSFYVYGLPPGAAFGGLGPFIAGHAIAAVSWTPGPSQAGVYSLTFEASSYPNPFHMETQRASCTTQVTIGRNLAVRVFAQPSNETTRLPRGKPVTCFQVEPLTLGDFAPEEVVPASMNLRYNDPSCGEIGVNSTLAKSIMVGDFDRNGIPEYTVCFTSEAMATLAACFPRGTRTARLELNGLLAHGDVIHGEVLHTFLVGGGSLGAAISPNPVSANPALEFTTLSTGSVNARLFDIRGRLVATLFDERLVPAGFHRVPLAGFAGLQSRLASGVYYLRVMTEHDGSETRTVMILR